MSTRLRVAVVEPQPLLEQRVRALVERAGAEPVGPDDAHDVALVCADAPMKDWEWTVERWTNGPSLVVLTRLRNDGGSAADLAATASIPRPFGAAELEAAFVEVREVLANGEPKADPDPTQPVPTDLRPEIVASHTGDMDAVGADGPPPVPALTPVEDEDGGAASVETGPTAEDTKRSTAHTPVAGVSAVPADDPATGAAAAAFTRRWAEVGAGLVEVWAELDADERVDALDRYLQQMLDESRG